MCHFARFRDARRTRHGALAGRDRQEVQDFQVRGGQVLYRADQDAVSVYELYLSTHVKGTIR